MNGRLLRDARVIAMGNEQLPPAVRNCPDGFDLRRALRLAQAAAAAYEQNPTAITHAVRASETGSFAADGVVGYAALAGDELIVAFRGTESRQLTNWLTNLDFAQVPAPWGRVHKGFARAVDGVWDGLARLVERLLPAGGNVWLTGHSLGGALAALAALRLAETCRVSGVYTFGAPRVGCPDFAAAYLPTLHRVEAADDLVCCLPLLAEQLHGVGPLFEILRRGLPCGLLPRDTNYCHAGELTLIAPGGFLRRVGTKGEDRSQSAERLLGILQRFAAEGFPGLLEQHRLDRYLAALSKAAKLAEVSPSTTAPCRTYHSGKASSPMHPQDRIRQQCSQWIEDLSPLASTLHEATAIDFLGTQLQASFGDPTIRVCVCGEWNAGKSSLINALTGVHDLLPVGILPTTSYVTVVTRAQAPEITVVRQSGDEPITPAELQAQF